MKFDMTTDAKEVFDYFNKMKENGSTWKVMNNHFMNMSFFIKTNTLKKVIETFKFGFLENQQKAIEHYINTPSNQGDAFRITSGQKRLTFLMNHGLNFDILNKDQQFLKKALFEYQNPGFIKLLLNKGACIHELDKIQHGRLISNTLNHTKNINKEIIYLLLENGCKPDCDTLYFLDKYFRSQSVSDFYIIDSPANNNFIKKLFLDTKQDELLFPNIFSLKPPFQVNMFEYAFYQNKELWNILLSHHSNLNIEQSLLHILEKITDNYSRYSIMKHVISCDISNLNIDYFFNVDMAFTETQKNTLRDISISQQKERLNQSLISEKIKTRVSRL